jgi:hypothetical protein
MVFLALRLRFDSWQSQEFFLLSQASILALGFSQLPVQYALASLSPWLKRRRLEQTTDLNLVPGLQMHVVTARASHVFSKYVGRLFFYNCGEVEIIGYSKVRTLVVIEKHSKNQFNSFFRTECHRCRPSASHRNVLCRLGSSCVRTR